MVSEMLPTLFNTYAELHTVELGIFLGLLVGLVYRDYPRMAYALLFVGVLSALVNAPHIGFARELEVATEIEASPWHFGVSLYLTTVGNLLVVEYGAWVLRQIAAFRAATEESVGSVEREQVAD